MSATEGEQSGTNRRFTVMEDKRLRELVAQFGAKRWRMIAQHMPGRTGRQCRDRYCNYLSPDFYNDKWTPEEDALLLEKHGEFGSHWTKLAVFFPGKTANNIKNRWNYSVSRMKDRHEVLEELQRKNQNKTLVMPEMICHQTIPIERHLPAPEPKPVAAPKQKLPPISSLLSEIPDPPRSLDMRFNIV